MQMYQERDTDKITEVLENTIECTNNMPSTVEYVENIYVKVKEYMLNMPLK